MAIILTFLLNTELSEIVSVSTLNQIHIRKKNKRNSFILTTGKPLRCHTTLVNLYYS